MNGYERIERTLSGIKTDYPPMMLHNFMVAAAETGLTMKEFRSKPENMAKALVETAYKYGLDGIYTDMDTALEAGAMGAPVDFPENDPARVTGPSGRSFDEILSKIDTRKLLSDERVQIYLEAIRLIRKQVGGEIFIRGNADQGPFSLAMLLYGMQDFLTDLMDEERKQDIFLLLDRCYQVHLAFHQMIMEAGADATSFGDSSCGPDLISRNLYLEFSNPYHKRLKRDLKNAGIRCICHICGNLDNIVSDVADTGFAGLEADYKTDMVRARDALMGKSVLFGSLDPSGVFFFGKPDEIACRTRELLALFKDGGLVIGAGCALPPKTPEINIRAFVDTVKKVRV